MRSSSFLAAAALAAACGAPPEAPATTRVDSAGVEVVTSRRPAWGEGTGWRVGESSIRFGGDASDDLYGVVGLARLGDGGVVLVDEGSRTVRWYDARGRLSGRAGGAGDGPGELRLPQAMGLDGGDTVWVYDYAHRRITWYGPDHAVARVVTLAPPLPSGVVVGRLGDGAFVVASQWGTGEGPLRTGLVRDTVPYAIYGADGVLGDTLGLFPGRETMHRSEGRRMVMSAAPFGRSSSHAALRDGLVVGDQTGRELQLLDRAGRVRRRIRWEGPSLELTPEDVGAWIERRVALAPSAERAGLRSQLTETPVPATRPAYGSILPDPTGALWVAEYAQQGLPPPAWDVFDEEGRWLGPVPMPERFVPMAVGPDWIAGVTRDAFDVERIEVRPLARDGGAG